MAEAPPIRKTPWIARDIARTWILVAVSIPIGIWLDDLLLDLPGIDAEALSDASLALTWAAYAFLWSISALIIFGSRDSATMHRWMADTTPPRGWRRRIWSIFGGGGMYWAVAGSLVAIISLVTVGVSEDEKSRPILMFAGLVVVIASVMLTIVAYAVRYAREASVDGGLTFPDTPDPVLSDYAYLSAHLTISLGGADVVVGSSQLRRLVTAHSIMAYAYNAIVLGLLVSVLIEVFS